MQYSTTPLFSNHENNGLLVKLKPIHHLNDPLSLLKTKMCNFDSAISVNYAMEKKDIIILAAMSVVVGLSLYRKYASKKAKSAVTGIAKPMEKNSLSVQPDDYEPYSGRKG
jgi:hypothetical protein